MDKYIINKKISNDILIGNNFKKNKEKSTDKVTVYSYDEQLTPMSSLLIDIKEKKGKNGKKSKFSFRQFKHVRVRFNADRSVASLREIMRTIPNSNYAIYLGWTLDELTRRGVLTKKLGYKRTMKF